MAKKKLKKDFDRDQMYSMIMPSINQEEPAAAENSLLPREAKPPAGRNAPPASESGAPVLHNFMEDLLREKLPHTMQVLRACTCERCTLDILAAALNELPGAYSVTKGGENAARIMALRRDYEVKVTATLIKAIQQVKSSPHHDAG